MRAEKDNHEPCSINTFGLYQTKPLRFLFTFTWAASFGLYAIWLGDKAGLDGIEIGTVFAVNGVFAVIFKPIYGYIMDKMGMKNICFTLSAPFQH